MSVDDGAPNRRPFDHVSQETRWAIQRQIADVTERRYQPAVRHAILTALRRSRADRTDLVQFDFLPNAVGADILLAQGALVLTRRAYAEVGARAILDAFGLVPREPIGCDELDARVVRTQNAALDAATLDMVAQLLRSRGFDGSVDYLFPLAPVGKGIGGPEPAPALGPYVAPPPGSVLRQVRVGVIDTGIANRKRGDKWLVSVPRTGANIDPLYDGPGQTLGICAAHGTFVAGIVAQVAPGADIRVYKSLDLQGLATDTEVAEAMVKAVQDDECEILNLSFGGLTTDNIAPVAITAALEIIRELDQQRNTTTVIVAAAGNGGDEAPVFPAACGGVVSVAALKADLTPAVWSSHGLSVDFSTIGEGVRSTFVKGQESPLVDPQPDTYGEDPSAFWVGSSFATPQIAGAIAKRSYEQNVPAHEALAYWQGQGTPISGFGRAIKILPGL